MSTPFTVITYYTPNFDCFAAGLEEDCRRFNYPLHSQRVPRQFENVIQAFDHKISFIKDMVQRFGRVLWLDVECRIVDPIPNAWSSPLISTYVTGKSQGFSSGVLMLDDSQLDFIDLWFKYAKRYPQYPDDFVLDFLATQVELEFMKVPLEFYDRHTTCPIARGLWRNEHTIIQHPTINRWPDTLQYRKAFNGSERKRRSADELISRQRKAIYFRNFAGDFDRVTQVMHEGTDTEFHYAGWVFDAINQIYAPDLYWPADSDDFTAKPRTFEKSWEYFIKKPKGRSFRNSAIRKMRLDAEDAQQYGQPISWLQTLMQKVPGIKKH